MTVEHVLEKAKHDQNVIAVILFGSQATDSTHAGSDTDLCIVFETETSFAETLEYHAMSTETLDISVLKQLPLHVQHQVFAAGEILYCADYDQLYDKAIQTMQEYSMFKPRQEMYRGTV